MKIKAINDLCQVSDEKLFSQVSEGMKLVIENCSHLYSDANYLLDNNRYRGYQVIKNIALEESAKFMILFDAIRCERLNNENFSKQLKRYNDHLPKGIYSEYYNIRPATYKEVIDWVNSQRYEYYLDGPSDVDWIFYNSILFNRENRMYVDYVEMDGTYQWITPENHSDEWSVSTTIPSIIPLTIDMFLLGYSKPESLKEIASIWRPIVFSEEFHWQDLLALNRQTLDILKEKSLLENINETKEKNIIYHLLFPLHSIELKKKVDKDELREIQKNWSPY
ncbi:MAG: AbiV family abortive infection protein [Tissierellales bacterium]|nr:AbiV family abortive infection protein [Tissierellales bacterium]